MTKQQATEIYFKYNRTALKSLKDLMLWNPKLTIKQNSQVLGITRQCAQVKVSWYNLKHKVERYSYKRKLDEVKL